MADFNLLGAGAGAAGGLEVLLKRLLDESDQKQKYGILQQEVNQRGRIADQTNQRLIEQNQLNSQIRKDALAQQVASQADAARVRGEQQVDRRISLRGPGDEVTPQEMNAEVASGVPTSLYNKIPGAQVTQTQGIAALPQSAPSGVSTLPMKAPVMPSLPSTTTTDANSPLNAPSVIKFKGTGSQRAAATKESDLVTKQQADIASKQAAVDNAAQHLQYLWSALSEKNASDNARNAATGERNAAQAETLKALTELRRAQAELADARKSNVENQGDPIMGAPILAEDGRGGYVLHSLHKSGQITTQPLPAGQKPTRAEPPGFMDKLKGLFGSSPAAPSAPRVMGDPTDPNWGK
jgi:hypothetical protein